MKKLILVAAVLVAVVISAQADILTWHSTYTYAYPSFVYPTVQYDGYGWQVDIAIAGSNPSQPSLVENAGTDAMWGWYDGYGYYVGGFQFEALEGETVVMRIFNATEKANATDYLDSLPVVLPDIIGIPTPGDVEVTFEFIPEPSSMAMMGLVSGLGLFVRRRFMI